MRPDQKLTRQEAEHAFIGALLFDSDHCQKVNRFPFAAEDFLFYRKIYTAILDTMENFGECDIVMARMTGNLKYEDYADFLAENQFSPSMINFYGKKLREYIILERTEKLKTGIAEQILSGADPVDTVTKANNEINEIRGIYGENQTQNDLCNAAKDIFNKIEIGEQSEALEFGFQPVDSLTFGLMPGEYVILAARPSCGKTALSLQLLKLLAMNDIPSFFFSLEMGAKAIVGRLMGSLLQMDMRQKIRKPHLTDIETRKAIASSKTSVNYIIERIRTTTKPVKDFRQIEFEARQAVKNGAKLLVLDYLQLLEGKGPNRNSQIEFISRSWKNLLKEVQVPGIMLSQLSRKCEEENRLPRLSDLRDSGGIEQDADIVWFLSQPKTDKKMERSDIIHLLQAKGRDSGIGKRDLMFNREIQTFFPVESN